MKGVTMIGNNYYRGKPENTHLMVVLKMSLMKYVVFFLVLILSGCASPSGVSSSDPDNASSDATGDSSPTPVDPQHVAQANNAFAFDLYKKINSEGTNLFFSPYSISSALAMTYSGAKGATRQQMSEVLGFYSDNPTHARGYHSLQKHLDSLNREELQLNMANSLWCQQDYDFQRDFLDINRDYFSAAIRQVNFKSQYQKVRKHINQWVEEQTNQKIKDLIDQGVLDRMTRMVLVNAIYFNGKWEHPFSEDQTRQDTFYPTATQEIKVPFMNQSIWVPYHEEQLYKAVEIPYSNGELSMLILLPARHADMSELESKMNGAFYENLTDSMRRQKVNLTIPRFKLQAKYQLNDPLRQMGMTSAFDGEADFSGMTGDKDLYISEVVHQSFVEVNEEGTEAAAATGVVMRKTSVLASKSLKADHPFLFMIRDQKTHAILFMGKMQNPK